MGGLSSRGPLGIWTDRNTLFDTLRIDKTKRCLKNSSDLALSHGGQQRVWRDGICQCSREGVLSSRQPSQAGMHSGRFLESSSQSILPLDTEGLTRGQLTCGQPAVLFCPLLKVPLVQICLESQPSSVLGSTFGGCRGGKDPGQGDERKDCPHLAARMGSRAC